MLGGEHLLQYIKFRIEKITNHVIFYTAFIEERTDGLGSKTVTLYEGSETVLLCHSYGYPKPYIAWLSNGLLLQNRSSDQDTNLVVKANGTIGTTTEYQCYATNPHGKDLYVVTATHAGM